jgi:preprotein translocase YajC subunit
VSLSLIAVLQQSTPGGGMGILAFQVLAIGLVFYFLILRPQGRARKTHAALLAGLRKNDDVMTAGGIVGKVKDIKEVESNGVKESRVTIESGGTTLIVERSRIVRVGGSTPVSGQG